MQNNVLDYLYDIVKTHPNKLAYSNGEFGLTFNEVLLHSRKVATFLNNRDIYGEPVLVFMDKHPKMITAFFGIIMSGNYYIPIDSEMPEIRIQLIIENVKPRMMICDENAVSHAKQLKYDGEIVLYDEVSTGNINIEALEEIHSKALDTDPIYIVFTSGSTGIPKGVVACHRSVIDYIEQLTDVLKIDENTIFGNQTPLYVDACLKELYPTLKMGATTYLIPKQCFSLPIMLVEFLNRYEINTVCWVVSALVMISAFNTFATIKPEYLRLIAFGSESFPIKQFNIWKQNVPNARYINLYGPTEGTGMSCYYEVNREFENGDVIPVGRPFKNTQVMLIKDDNTLAAPGEDGEICLRGTCLTMGYYNNPDKTNECFVQNPFNSHYPELIYKTGDFGHLNKYGELEFVSRKDYQVKHMGHRIELGEIEANVNALDCIKMAGCIYDEDKKKIVLFFVGDTTAKDITILLKEKLPRYMLPNSINKLENMPLTLNGKLDRKALKDIYKNL